MTVEQQTSGTVLMVRPASFGFHAEAAQSNAFASAAPDGDATAAQREFDAVVEALDGAGVEVLILDDQAQPEKPDAVFPNNWVSFHGDGTIVLYAIATAARRLERNADGLQALLAGREFQVRKVVDLSAMEDDGCFLEGTGSLILDRPHRRAFANLSPRTDAHAVGAFDEALGYSTHLFEARDRSGRPIYHTNVLLSLGSSFAILCSDVVAEDQRAGLIGELQQSGRTIVEVDYKQMRNFACNLIELRGRAGPVIALSAAARASFRPDQLRLLESFGELASAEIPTIERVGGGSVRCMIADMHLPRRAT